jgi:Ca-activated chloride channel homolog
VPTTVDAKTLNELGFVKIRWKEPNGDVSTKADFALTKDRQVDSIKDASEDLRFAAAVAGFAQVLRGHLSSGAPTLKQVIELAKGARGADTRGERAEFIELVQSAAAIKGEKL